jgi:hypothetical protein
VNARGRGSTIDGLQSRRSQGKTAVGCFYNALGSGQVSHFDVIEGKISENVFRHFLKLRRVAQVD